MIDTIDKFPIIILSSPRTGSTVLAEIISKKFPKLQWFSEPDCIVPRWTQAGSMDKFTKYSKISNQYILKCHLNYLSKYPTNLIETVMNHDAFLIKISRRNVISQMVSTYIEMVRQIWYYDMSTVKKYNDEIIPIKDEIIERAVRRIKECNESFNEIQLNYNLEICYEDFISNINDSYRTNSKITPKPINYTEIYQLVQQEFERSNHGEKK